ncbi:hypothetical protein [Candidatus Cardinium sp. cByotN1]|nr:hypothetical protein [Candidatus Cardinium sp. cByotN1]
MHLYKTNKTYLLLFCFLFLQPIGNMALGQSKVRLGISDRDAQLLLAQYATAQKVYQAKNYAQASALFERLIKMHHSSALSPYIHFYYALATYHNGATKIAREAFLELQAKFPDWNKQNETHYWFAQCSFETGNFEQALNTLALIKDKSMAEPILEMKKYFLKQIQADTALQELVEKFPNDLIIKNILHKKVAKQAYFTQDFARLDALKQQYHLADYTYDPLKQVTSKRKTAYDVAIFLPFFVEEFDYEACTDQFVIELYQGIQLAIEKLAQEGIVINLFVFDTKRDATVTKALLAQEGMPHMDLIIGPLYPETIPLVATFAKKHKINLVNPISDNAAVTKGNPFAFLFQPDLETCAQRAAQLTLSDLSGQSTEEASIGIFYGTDPKEVLQANLYKTIVEQQLGKNTDLFLQLPSKAIKEFFNQASKQKAKEEEDIATTEKDEWDLSKLTHIYVPSQNELLVSNVISLCLKLGIKPQIIGHEQWIKKEILHIHQLKRLSIVFLAPNYIDYSRSALSTFRKKFFEKNSTQPNEKGYIGYEMMLFFGRMLGRYGTSFQKEWGNMHYSSLIFQGLSYGKHHANQHIPVLRFAKDKFVVDASLSNTEIA